MYKQISGRLTWGKISYYFADDREHNDSLDLDLSTVQHENHYIGMMCMLQQRHSWIYKICTYNINITCILPQIFYLCIYPNKLFVFAYTLVNLLFTWIYIAYKGNYEDVYENYKNMKVYIQKKKTYNICKFA